MRVLMNLDESFTYNDTKGGELSLNDNVEESSLRSWFLLRSNRLPLFIGQHVAEGVERSCSLEQCAAVHDDELAVDVSGMIAHQKCGQVRELFMRPKASDWTMRPGHLFHLFHRQQTGKRAFGGDCSRANRIEPYAV